MKTFEQFNEIDPYNEEDWNDSEPLRRGDHIICIDPIGRLERGEYIVSFVYNSASHGQYGHYIDVSKLNGDELSFCKAERFIKKPLLESFKEIDPYDEEEWDDAPLEIGEVVICINPFDTQIKVGDEFVITHKYTEKHRDYKYVDVRNKNGKMYYCYNAKRFKRKPVLESFKEIDPYSEENWYDVDNIKLKVGQKLTCIKDYYWNISASRKHVFFVGKEYKISRVEQSGWVYVKTNETLAEPMSTTKLDKYFDLSKLVKENINEIDPYNEEDWNDMNFNKGDLLIAKKDRFNKSGTQLIFVGKTYKLLNIVDWNRDYIGPGDYNKNYYVVIDPNTKNHTVLTIDEMKEHFNKK